MIIYFPNIFELLLFTLMILSPFLFERCHNVTESTDDTVLSTSDEFVQLVTNTVHGHPDSGDLLNTSVSILMHMVLDFNSLYHNETQVIFFCKMLFSIF